MDHAMTIQLLVLLSGALWWYLIGVRADKGEPSERLRELIVIEGRNAVEIERLETLLNERDPEWRVKQRP